ncbi:MAG: DUF4422 domain-containing protein [Alphaproteobacteria bacterium]|nr:DUF4422 domain-containing protein [Alphaproteobacteria bacterium]
MTIERLESGFNRGDYRAAERDALAILRADPHERQALEYLWRMIISTGDVTAARGMLSEVGAGSIDDSYPLAMLAGLSALLRRDSAEALRLFSRAGALSPGPDAALMVGHALLQGGDREEAGRAFLNSGHSGGPWSSAALANDPTPAGNARIYVAFHKPFAVVKAPLYQPIHVGKALAKLDLGMPGDDTGDNISSRNDHYCELTGIYWVWRNVTGLDHVGFCHYRRYPWFGLALPLPQSTFDPHTFFSPPRIAARRLAAGLDMNFAARVLSRADVLVPQAFWFAANVRDNWILHHRDPDILDLTIEVVARRDPRMAPPLVTAFSRSYFRAFNMFIMRWPLFDAYCDWLFGILFEVERLAGPLWEPRAAGFLAERLLNVWIEKQINERARIADFPVVNLE